MLAALVLAGFVPMLWSGQEANLEEWYASLLHVRAGSAALLRGLRHFNPVPCSSPDVLTIVRQQDGETIWGVVSLHAERTPLEFDLSRWVANGDSPFRLFDLLSHTPWEEAGRTSWPAESARALRLAPIPFVPYFWRIDPTTVDQEVVG